MEGRRRRTCLLIVLGLVGLAAQQGWQHGARYVLPVRFKTVVRRRVYRGAWQEDWPLRRIVKELGVRTIVALAHPPDHDLPLRERGLAEELGVRWVHIPILDDPALAGGKTIDDLLEEAADVVADPANQPVFFHCHHGLVRASMVQVAFRTKHCGWTLEQAEAEVRRQFDGADVLCAADHRRLAGFYGRRVLPSRSGRRVAAAEAVAR